jgi:FkbM family methyltransferase
MELIINSELSHHFRESPIVLVDVGVSGGFKKIWEPMKQYLKVVGFEPDERALECLSGDHDCMSEVYLGKALFREKGEQNFYMTRKQQVSSIYKPNRQILDYYSNPERFDIMKKVSLSCDTMDNQLAQNGISNVDFIKLDTQGSELDILQGAEVTLDQSGVFGVEVEVEFQELYENQPLFPEVDTFMRKKGFQLFDIRPCYWTRFGERSFPGNKGQVVFCDAIYFKSIEAIDSMLAAYDDATQRKAKVLRMIPICLAYHHPDYAAEIIQKHDPLFSKDERKLLNRCIENHSKQYTPMFAKLPNFPGRGKIAQLFFSIWKSIQPNFWKCRLYLNDGQQVEKY